MDIAPRYQELYGPFFVTRDQAGAHNAEVAKVWEAYKRDAPIRVPATWGAMNPMRLMYADESLCFRDYWHDSEQMLRLQATAAALSRRIITTDDAKGPRAAPVGATLDFHPFGDETYWGCPVEFYDRDQPRVYHIYSDAKVPPSRMAIPDPFSGGFMDTVWRMYNEMSALVQTDISFAGLRFTPRVRTAGMKGTYGIFNTALQMRGTALFLDMFEDPEYVHGLLDVVSRGYVHRVKAWEKETQKNKRYNICYDHGIDMMSTEHYEQFLVPVYERVKAAFGAEKYDANIEHCGRGEAVLRYKHERFGIDSFSNLNASFLDLEKLRHDLGPEVYMQVTIHPGLVHTGPIDKVREAVKETLTPALKGRGRLTFGIQGDNFRAPIKHLVGLYEAVKEYGHY